MIVTIGTTKGGAGKTTIALNLAAMRSVAGKDVWLIDGDRQSTAMKAVANRSSLSKAGALACSAYPDGPTLRQQVLLQGGKFEDVVIDVGGRDSTALRAAILVSDVLAIPVQPRSFDVWAIDETWELVEEARSMRDGLRVCAFLNLSDQQGRDNQETLEFLGRYRDLELLPSVGRRKVFSNASASGLSVLEFEPRDQKACQEIQSLFDCIYQSI